ncbi:MAG: HD domain-containing protein [Candidatus Paceibacteria bacterium]
MTENAQGLTDIGRLVLQFAKVNRVTFHEDGVTPESDSDHTVMTSVCACALGHKLYPEDLDHGLVAQFAIVHDLVEAYAGDTDTFGFKEEQKAEKNEREHKAFLRIKEEFKDIYPWLPDTIEVYERLDTKEARFVKTVDKLMTKITHILNKGVYFKGRGLSKEQMWAYYSLCRPSEVKFASEFPALIALIDEMILEARVRTYGS